jgi:hypothetical protein
MPKTNYKPTKRRKIHQTRRKKYNLRRWIFLLILGISLIFTGFYLKNKIAFYYAMHFHKHTEQNLKNSKTEAARIEKIITEYNDKTFGFDISHYQKKEDINFDKVSENPFLNELYNAKGYLNTINHSNDFDLDILILINKHEHKINASLDFEFICNSCKHSHPVFDTRCPHCHSILTFDVKHHLTKSFYNFNQSLQ